MKKIIFGIMLLLSVSFCFAVDNNIDIGIGIHNMISPQTRNFPKEHKETGHENEIPTDLEPISSFAINLAYMVNIYEYFGFGLYVNILFPPEVKYTAEGTSTTIDSSEYEFPKYLSGDFTFGPAFKIYSNEIIDVSLTVGFHFYFFLGHRIPDPMNSNCHFYQLGLGTNVSCRYHFSPRVYAFATLQLSYDFYSGYSSGGTAGKDLGITTVGGTPANRIESDISAWIINPCIGIGFAH